MKLQSAALYLVLLIKLVKTSHLPSTQIKLESWIAPNPSFTFCKVSFFFNLKIQHEED